MSERIISRRDFLKMGLIELGALATVSFGFRPEKTEDEITNIEWLPTLGTFLPRYFAEADDSKQKAIIDKSTPGIANYTFLETARISGDTQSNLTLGIRIPRQESLSFKNFAGGGLYTFIDGKGNEVAGTVVPAILLSAKRFAGGNPVDVLLTTMILISDSGLTTQFIVPGILKNDGILIDKETRTKNAGFVTLGQNYFIRVNENRGALYYTAFASQIDRTNRF